MSTSAISPSRLMWRFLVVQRWRVAGAITAGVLTITSSVCLLAVSAYLIERASQQPPILSLTVAIVSVRFFGIARGVFRYLDRYLSHDASFRLLADIRSNVYRTLIPLSPAGLHDISHGELLTRIAADVDTMQEWFVRGFAPVCTSVLTAALIVGAAAIILPLSGAVLFLSLIVAAMCALAATRTGDVARREIELRAGVTSATLDYLRGIADLTALGAASEMASRIEMIERERAQVAARRARHNALAIGIQTALPGLLAVMIGAVAIASLHGGFNPLGVGVLVFGAMAAAECVAALPGSVEAWERGRVAAQRLAELAERPCPVTAEGSSRLPRPAQQLSISNVSYRYDDSSPYVLDDVSLTVSVGERVVIVGRSGAGKTTLAMLLLRFLSPSGGSISLDGIDLADLVETSVRQTVGAATQHAHLFAGTIRDNIMLARPDAAESELRAAIQQAQLDEWIDRLPNGWNTEIGELGSAISGGQRRRIALARALLGGFPFLIADEPTEGLDTPTARAVMETLFSSTSDRGLIVITHRLDLCPPADVLYRLDDGKLTRLSLDPSAHHA